MGPLTEKKTGPFTFLLQSERVLLVEKRGALFNIMHENNSPLHSETSTVMRKIAS